MDKKYSKFDGKDYDDVFKAADSAFEKAQEAFDMAGDYCTHIFESSTSSNTTTAADKPKNTEIKFSGNRWNSFWKFIKCAFQILFTNKTSIVFKHQ